MHETITRRTWIAVAVVASLAYARLAWVVTAAHLTGGARRHHVESAWFILAAVCLAAALRLRREPPRSTHARFGGWPPVLAIALAGSFALYWPALSIGLLSDDFVLLSQPLSGGWEFLRPVPLLLWKAVHPLAGAAGLHGLNIVLHGVNAALLWIFAARIGCGTAGRWTAALFFLTFPAAVEPVAWSAGIFDVLLVTLTLGASLLAHDPRRAGRTAAVLLIAAALLTKETAVVMPVLLVLAAAAMGRRVLHPAIVLAAVCVAGYVAFRLVAMPGASAPLPRVEGYVLKELVGRPFASLVLPWTRAEITRHPMLFAVIPQLVVGALIVASSLRRGGAALWPLAAWTVASVLPLVGYLYVGESLDGSRYLYLPLVGFSLLVARLLETPAAAAPRATYAAAALVVALHAAGARAHIAPWREAASLRDQVLAAARSAHDESGCRSSSFAGVPDSVEGAYVFRNGFETALGRPVADPRSAAAGDCAFVWSGGRFVRHR